MVQLSAASQRNRRLVEAKQRASVQWLLSKAYGHQVPEDIKEPFYRDLEDQEYLKPALVHALANAELYCLALAHIYADPNYSQLNHWGVIQALARKGIYVAEPSDVALTETTLIHTSPLRMSAHMAVMEGIMGLFVKEIVSAERVVAAVRKFAELSGGSGANDPATPKDAEQAMLLWINKSCAALKKRLEDESEAHGENIPNFAEVRELADLGDGVSLIGLLSFYCPEFMDWTRMASNEPLSMADCLYNLQLVHSFCLDHLPYNVCHLSLEDLVYMHSSVRQNVLALLADLFYLLEIRPAKCVRPPVLMRDRFNLTSATNTEGGKTTTTVTVRRQGSLQERDRTKRQTIHEAAPSAGSTPRRWDRSEAPSGSNESRQGDSDFVVHRGKTVPTLHHVTAADGATPRLRAKEKFNTDTKAEERGEDQPAAGRSSAHGPAGVPSNWEERKQTYAGRRSRRNSITDDSHLTIENFGGSQDNLSLLGRNPDKEPVALAHSGRRPSIDSGSHFGDMPTAGTPSGVSSTAAANFWKRNNERTRSQENLSDYMFVDNRDVEEQERRCSRASSPYSSISSGNNTSKSNGGGGGNNNKSIVIIASNPTEASDLYDPHDPSKFVKATNFAELSKLRESLGSSAINIVYMQQDKDSATPVKNTTPAATIQRLRPSSVDNRKSGGISIAEATSWDPQVPESGSLEPEPHAMDTAEMYSIRLKMEEKRKRIEAEKRHQELMASKQREKVGKAAFLQAVAKGKGSGSGSGTDSPTADYTRSMMTDSMESPTRAPSYHHPPHHMSTPDPADAPPPPAAHMADYHHVEYANSMMTMGHHPSHPHMASPYDPYRPANGMTPEPPAAGQFYLHQPSPGRRTWGQPQPISPAPAPPMSYAPDASMGPYASPMRRAQWGTPQPVRPMLQMSHGGYMVSSPASFMDQHMQQQGYAMTPPRHPADPYDHAAHFYANGSHYQPPPSQEEAYFYSPSRPFNLQQPQQPQQHPSQAPQHPQHPQPQPSPQQQQQQQQQPQQPQSFMSVPSGSSTTSYPSMADQRAPFRLHSAESDSSKSSGPKNLVQQVQSPQGPPVKEQPVVKSSHSTSGRSSSNGVSSSGAGTSSSVLHTAMPTPSIDDMEPQNVSFIETPSGIDEADEIPRRLRNLNITSGNRTYRIPHSDGHSSPPRPALIKTFRLSQSPVSSAPKSPSPIHGHYTPDYTDADRESPEESSQSSQSDPSLGLDLKTAKLKENVDSDRGFIITFDDDNTAPKRPKPQLGVKRHSLLSPSKKSSVEHQPTTPQQPLSNNNKLNDVRVSREDSPRRSLSSMAREIRGDTEYSPFTPDSGFGGGQNSQDELKLFHAATAAPLSSSSAINRSHDRDSSQDEEVSAAMIIGDETGLDPDALDEMERKKERILLQSLRRKQQQEEVRQRKEMEAQKRKEEERFKEEEKNRKKEEEKQRRAIILEQYKIKKAMEEAEKEGRVFEMPDQMNSGSKSAGPKMRNKNGSATMGRPRPKTIHISSDSGTDLSRASSSLAARGKRGSGTNLTDSKTELRSSGSNSAMRGSNPTLNRRGSNSSLHADSLTPNRYRTIERGHTGRKDHSVPRIGQSGGSVRSSREDLYGGGGSRAGGFRGSNSSLNDAESYEAFHTTLVHSGRKGSGFMTGPGSLPPGLVGKRGSSRGGGFDDGASDVSSGAVDFYGGPKLYKQPAARSNRSIILNAVEYCVFPGVVNREAKQRVLEEIMRSESKNFLILFRDGQCMFRALYSYNPEREEILKLYGNGPKQVTDNMFEKFFKYNSGGKCFSQVHTKHLTVTIDAFTIHASLWQGKKASLPNRKDMTLVI